MEQLSIFDRQLTSLLYSLISHSSFFDGIFSFFSMRGDFLAVWIFITMVGTMILYKKLYPALLVVVASLASSLIIVNLILKNIFTRIRPYGSVERLANFCPMDFSFPSGHAAGSFAVATVLAHYDKKRAWMYYLLAVIISYSRIYLGCHFFLDIFIGGIIGFTVSKLLLKSRYLTKFGL